MVQILKYAGYLVAFFLTLYVLVWVKYSVSPEEKVTKTEKKLSYNEADNIIKGTIDYKHKNYFKGHNSVVIVSTDGFLSYKYDTLTSETNYYSKDKE